MEVRMSRLVCTLVFVTIAGCATTPVTSVETLRQIASQAVATQAPGAMQEGHFLVGSGPKADFAVMLEAGKCYWFSGATDELGGKMALYLFAPPDRHRLSDARSRTTTATMGHCPVVTGMNKVQAKTRPQGAFVVGVYSVPTTPSGPGGAPAAYAPDVSPPVSAP
jgi:hypothetical protein